MKDIIYIDRMSKAQHIEKVYGSQLLKLLYGNSASSRHVGRKLASFVAKNKWVSQAYGWWQKKRWTKRKIKPFIAKFEIDPAEFAMPLDSFTSFNDFFIRHLKKEARPLAGGQKVAIVPADGRYLFYANIATCPGFVIKGQKFNLSEFLCSDSLAKEYEEASMVIARLCPSDYHRFHFPCDCLPAKAVPINGLLYSVNPLAIKQNIKIFSENKRTLTTLSTQHFGQVLYIEVGATNVGTIVQTYTANQPYAKGAEKGFFSFGGSTLVLLFPKESIQFDPDLLAASQMSLEIKCLMGQSMGQSMWNHCLG